MSDPYKKIREEIDELSMQQIKELYQIKKKIKILEEELLISDEEIKRHFQDLNPLRIRNRYMPSFAIKFIFWHNRVFLSNKSQSNPR